MGAQGGRRRGGRLMYPNVPFNHFRKIKSDRLTDELQHRF